jgi:hypothetical protein
LGFSVVHQLAVTSTSTLLTTDCILVLTFE